MERRITGDPGIVGQMDNEEIGPPPEGGREAWCCVAAAFFLLFTIFGFCESLILHSNESGLMIVTSFGTLQEYYLNHQLRDHTKSDVAYVSLSNCDACKLIVRWISSVSSFAVFAGSLSAGRYFDSHGSFTLTMTGTILSVSSLVAIAFCKEYYQFMLAHLLFGMSGSFIYSPATAVSGHWFLRKRSTAVGIVVCGSGLGGVIYPIALRRLFDQVGMSFVPMLMRGY